MLNDLHSEIVNFDFSSPPTRGSSTGASVLGHSLGCSHLLRQTSTVPQLTVNLPEGLVDTAVPEATGGRSAQSLSQGSASAVHLVSCHSVPQAPSTVPENSLLAFYAFKTKYSSKIKCSPFLKSSRCRNSE